MKPLVTSCVNILICRLLIPKNLSYSRNVGHCGGKPGCLHTLPFYVTSFEQWCMKQILGRTVTRLEYGLNVYKSHEVRIGIEATI